MACIDMDVIRELPGYKVILKAVLKAQIQQLIDQLAACTDEESVILTASVSDGSLSHLGSESGKSFLQENDDVKSKFLGYCLKRFHVKAQQEREQPLRSYGLVHQSRRTHHHVGATRANTRTFQRHQPYPSNRKAFKSASESPVVPLAIVANTARDAKETKSSAPATEGAELDKDAGTVSLDSEEQSDANESHFPENDTQSNNATKVDEQLVKADNSAGEEGDNDDSVVGVSVKIESGVDSMQDQPAQDSGWDPDESLDLAQYSAEASRSSPGQAMEDAMAHHSNTGIPDGTDQYPYATPVNVEDLTCAYCYKVFPHKGNLRRHIRIHEGIKPFKCEFCDKRFSDASNCKKHAVVHLLDSNSF
ncbi:zinc finger protein egl-43-like [Dreissena polymorpha]|uniref:C2H2-type domain-containing protein n=1 Tax=Dreissena polymorpha TaxID=45954 RepID=A0A9D4NP73_DREPO|nr:zinc finger protein egl-43-like [Dreissena polymorpha]XP_052260302.1 zinc finger protein egl-43-like [Dreissena polymorpha]XP_052260303.1 zinc finger protein egl-43-like [Dreissena polymorpha]XP_052260304.1 zinc finger protein egl-43-like [Dreissena polymorpha]KAH3897252.1 hypothetical protein DPMN_021438 [Dreissena polymorpha]